MDVLFDKNLFYLGVYDWLINSCSDFARPIKKPTHCVGFFIGAPGEIRTPDQVVRSHLLYPAELRVHKLNCVEFSSLEMDSGCP